MFSDGRPALAGWAAFDAIAADLERDDASRRRSFQSPAHGVKTPLAVVGATAAAVMERAYARERPAP